MPVAGRCKKTKGSLGRLTSGSALLIGIGVVDVELVVVGEHVADQAQQRDAQHLLRVLCTPVFSIHTSKSFVCIRARSEVAIAKVQLLRGTPFHDTVGKGLQFLLRVSLVITIVSRSACFPGDIIFFGVFPW